MVWVAVYKISEPSFAVGAMGEQGFFCLTSPTSKFSAHSEARIVHRGSPLHPRGLGQVPHVLVAVDPLERLKSAS